MNRLIKIFIPFILILLLTSNYVSAQDLRDVMRDYERGNLIRVKRALNQLEPRYGDKPEFLFLKAVFEENADKAYSIFQQINEADPDNPVFEKTLWKMCQYNYAKGLYKAAHDMLDRFLITFPRSRYFNAAEEMQVRTESKIVVEPEPVVDDPLITGNTYSVQIDAFGSKSNAERRLRYYKRIGISHAYIKEQNVGRQLIYKIWVGEYPSIEDARRAGEALQNKYNLSSFMPVVKKM